jgi:4-amino-4-deoxy-L-arabinose transferase-like glycosyltransferase
LIIAEYEEIAEDALESIPAPEPQKQYSRQSEGWYFGIVVVFLITAAFFRLWHLGTAPPGMHSEELINIQLSEQMKQGHISVIYEEARPAREGLYFVLLGLSTALTGKGLILWRLPSVWISMLTLAMTATLLRRLFGARAALLAVGLLAVSFWPVWIGRVVLNVTLLPLITSFAIYALVRAYLTTERMDSSLWFTVGGIALGIAQYIHGTAWTLFVLLIAFVAYRALLSRAEVRTYRGNVLYALSLTAVLVLPLLIFITRHPGAREPVPITEQPGLLAEIPGRILASIAALPLRGDMLPQHNVPGRPIMGPMIAILMIIGTGVAFARWRRPAYGLALLWMIIGLLPTAFVPNRGDFETMAVILPIVFIFPALGMESLYVGAQKLLSPVRWEAVAKAITAIMALLIVANAGRTYYDYFVKWPLMGDVRLSYQADLGILAHYLDTSPDPTPVSICSTPVDRQANPFALTNAQLLKVLMHRHDLPIRYFDCTQGLVLANGGESQRLIFPRGHYYDHLPGPLLAWMRYAHNEPVAGMRPDVVMRIDVSTELADVAGAFITTAPTAWPPEVGSELAALPVSFEGNVTFLGYTVRDSSIRATDWVELTTYWRLDGPPPRGITIFTHLLGTPVIVIAQDIGLGADISTLQARDVFLQYSMIQTPGRMTEGLYPLSIGLYYIDSEQRLSAYDHGDPRATRLFLQRLEVKP